MQPLHGWNATQFVDDILICFGKHIVGANRPTPLRDDRSHPRTAIHDCPNGAVRNGIRVEKQAIAVGAGAPACHSTDDRNAGKLVGETIDYGVRDR